MLIWIYRLHFAFLLLICGELIGWQETSSYQIQDWILIFGIYLATAALLLDLSVRWKIEDWKSLLLLAGLFGLAEGTLISLAPETADNPAIGLIFRPLGLEVLMFLLAFWMFRLLHSGEATGLFAFLLMAMVGAAWGVWVRWFPELEYGTTPELVDSLPYVLATLFLAGLLPLFFRLSPMKVENWQLSFYEIAAAGLVLLVTLILRVSGGYIDILRLSVIIVIAVFIGFMLYFTRSARQKSLLESITPPKKPLLPGWLIILFPFAALAWMTYDISSKAQANVLFGAMSVFGVLWLPVVSTWTGYNSIVDVFRESYS